MSAALVLAVAFHLGTLCAAQGQAAPPSEPPAKGTPPPEEQSQVELLKSYLQIREQLHATQLAIAKDRAEAEATSRAQASALAEKLDTIKSAMETERDRHRLEFERAAAERERQQTEAQRSSQNILWVAAAFGAVGIAAMFLTPLFQWRAIRRMAEVASPMPQLSAAGRPGLMPPDAAPPLDQAVAFSNQRLMSVIDRLERRILELEHTTVHPLPAPAPAHTNGRAETAEAARRIAETEVEEDGRITVLLAKGRALLSANKAKEAASCYDEVLKIVPNHAEALVKKGAALERLTRDEEAIRCYDRAIEADRNMTLAYLYKGGVCNRLGRYDDALECYERALQTEEAAR